MTLLTYPSELNTKEHFATWIMFSIFERNAPDNAVASDQIQLYMPDNISIGTNTQWDTVNAGKFGAEVLDNGILSGLGALGNVALGRARNIVTSVATGMTTQQASAIQDGKWVNPNMRQFFSGVGFRSFDFNFKFTPKKPEESNQIQEIIQRFRAAALPDAPDGKRAYTWGYPNELKISYWFAGDEHPYLTKYKTCVLTSVKTDYTSSGNYVSMRDGFPAETQLSLSFSEIEILSREDIEEGF